MLVANDKLNNHNLDQVIRAEANELSKLLVESNLRAKEQALRNREQIVTLTAANEALHLKVEKQNALLVNLKGM